MNKYGNKKIVTEDGVFDSKKEFIRWRELQLLQRAGEIHGLQRQVSYLLIGAQRDPDSNKLLERECRYVADFVYLQNGETIVEDVKSKATRTPEYIIKRKLLLREYGLRIREV
jgi:hypothetical protein